MNKHTYTFLTLFLLISSLFGNPVRGESSLTPVLAPKGTILDNGEYYLVKNGDSKYLIYKTVTINSKVYTTADVTSTEPTSETLNAYLWQVKDALLNNAIVGCYFVNKATGDTLTYDVNGDPLKEKSSEPLRNLLTISANGGIKENMIIDNAISSTIIVNGAYKNNSEVNIWPSSVYSHSTSFYTISSVPLSAADMNSRKGTGFSLGVYNKPGVEDNVLLNKPLTALTICSAGGTGIAGTSGSTSAMYFVASGYEKLAENGIVPKNYIVTMTTGEGGNEATVKKAFKEMTFVYVSQDVVIEGMESLFSEPGVGRAFKTVTGEELLRNSMEKNAQFTVTYNPTNGTAKSTNRIELALESATFSSTNVPVRPYVYMLGNKQYLTSVKSDSKDKDYFTFGGGGGEVTFASLKDKMFSIVIADQEVLKKQSNGTFKPDPDSYLLGWKFNPDCTTSSSTSSETGITTYANTLTFAKGDYFLEDKPEGLWIFSYVNGQYYVQNCESANKLWLGTSIIQDSESDNLYVLETPLEGVVDGNTLRIDSLRITEKTLSPFDGYAHSQLAGDQFDVATLLTTPYQLGVQIMTLGVAYVQLPASSAILSITTNLDNGLKLMFTPCDTLEYGVLVGSDEEKLKRVRYAIIDQNSNRYIKYDNAIGCLKLDESAYLTSEEALKAASTFYIKEKGTDLYELVLSDGYYNDLTGKWIEKVGSKKKVFANISQANLPLVNLYTPMTGDKFGLYAVQEDIKPSDNILNKLIGKRDTTLVRLNFISTMNGSSSQPWMLAVDADRFLVEGQPIRKPNIDIDTKAQGGLEYEPVNFSLILDTAYVQRAGVTTPLYYIAMPSDKTSEQIQQVGKKTVGYYLFAMTDSIHNSVDKNREDRYCYHFWSQHNPRLRFVQATHEGDTIYIETANPSAKDTIQAGSTEGVALAARQRAWLAAQSEGTAGNPQNNTNKGINYGLFAFEANPKAAEGSLEYALWNPASNRYVTYLNGNVVLTQEPTYYKLDVSRPDEGHFVVANEPVVAEPEPFAVVGGIGQVEIRQAAGKQVHIYNILGKELAHRRLTSDRELIALPKGIAIVAVEGETPVKAIVQ